MEEGILTLKKGALVAEFNLVYKSAELSWQFWLKGESLNFSGLNMPDTGAPESEEDLEGAVLEKIYLYEKLVKVFENIYNHFIKLRLSDTWNTKTIPEIGTWIKST